MDGISPNASISNKEAKILANSILARDRLVQHRCNISWCAHHDIACDDSIRLWKSDEDLFILALEIIKKYVPNNKTTNIRK